VQYGPTAEPAHPLLLPFIPDAMTNQDQNDLPIYIAEARILAKFTD